MPKFMNLATEGLTSKLYTGFNFYICQGGGTYLMKSPIGTSYVSFHWTDLQSSLFKRCLSFEANSHNNLNDYKIIVQT